MFSKELENLIQATLEDGVLEDFEKAALVKRAQAEGVDLAELEIYINSILQKRQKEMEKEKNAKIEQHNKEKKEALGRVCPNCGKQVPPMTLKCECGFEFTNTKTSSSVELLAEKIEEINCSIDKGSEKEKLICDAIEMFPVPNTKEDILEFLSIAVSNINKPIASVSRLNTIFSYIVRFYTFGLIKTNPGETDYVLQTKRKNAWRGKFDQVILKGRSLRGDPEFQKQLDYYQNMVNNN